MGFNYTTEKAKFDKKWDKLRKEYQSEGMLKEDIQTMHDHDWQWFCSRRTYINRTQDLPSEVISEDTPSESNLIKKYESLSVTFDESVFEGRFNWIETIERTELVDKLKKLSVEDLELLTLYAIDGYSQPQIAEKFGKNQSNISRKISGIKNKLKNFSK